MGLLWTGRLWADTLRLGLDRSTEEGRLCGMEAFADLHKAGQSLALWLNGLKVQRAKDRRKVSVGTWYPHARQTQCPCVGSGRGLVKVRVPRGRWWSLVGFNIGGSHYLYPEEALYLVDRGVLALEHPAGSGKEMPVDVAYTTLLGAVDFATYFTYASLRKLGYAVLRRGFRPATEPDIGEVPSPTATADDCGPAATASSTGPRGGAGGGAAATAAGVAADEAADALSIVHTAAMPRAPATAVKRGRDDDSGEDEDRATASAHPVVRARDVEPQITFEVWSPSGPFRKTDPGPPAFVCVVVSCGCPLPRPADVARLRGLVSGPTSIRFATVDSTNTVMFFEVGQDAIDRVSSAII